MASNKRVKIFQRAMARNGLFFFSWVLKYLPYWGVRGLSFVLTNIGFQFVLRQKRIARESLTIAFGKEKSPQEIDKIMKKCFNSMGLHMIEMLYYLAHPELVSHMCHFEGKENLDAALAEEKGVIAFTAHFGNFPLMMLYSALQGYKTNCIIRPARDQKLEKYLLQKRSDAGLNTIYATPRKGCVDQSIKVLRNKELLFIPLDQNAGSAGSVFVDFFGQKAATAVGPIIFARRTKSPILPMFIVRQDNNFQKIIVDKPIYIEEKGTDEETIYHNISRITRVIEKYVCQYPYEWGWMHRRWKSRPQNTEAEGVPQS